MIGRCHNPNHSGYKWYGAQGIYVCEEWRKDFPAFLGHIGTAPGSHYTVDRIDRSKGYEAGNVRWATPKEQANNKSNNRCVTSGGRTLTVTQWAEELGISEATLRDRLDNGWTPEDAVSTPRLTRQRNVILIDTEHGQRTLREISEETGVKYQTVRWRYKHGKPLI